MFLGLDLHDFKQRMNKDRSWPLGLSCFKHGSRPLPNQGCCWMMGTGAFRGDSRDVAGSVSLWCGLKFFGVLVVIKERSILCIVHMQ